MAAPKSSLQRLLSLDKTFDSFDERVREAARILGLDLGLQSPSDKKAPSLPPSLSYAARLDFVLRWLLDKLSSQPDARQCLPSWILLRRVLEHMPPAALAKSLSTAHPLNTCSTALADIFPPVPSPSSKPADDANRSTKKRKRQSAANDTPSDQPALIFADITASVRLLISRSTPSASASHAASENRVHALLRLDHADLVRFIKHTFFALLHLQSSGQLLPYLVTSTLKLIQDLSILQPNASVDPSDLSFCTECLWPAALLLRFLHSTPRSDDASHHHTQQAIQLLDRFLATHLFVPARVAFNNAKVSTQKKRQQPELPGLVQRLDPLRTEITALLADGQDSAQRHQLPTVYESIPLLLDLGVRCSPTANPKQRIAEGPWIHMLFTSLSDTFTSSVSTSDAAMINQTLLQMLNILASKSLTLDPDVLIRILDERCNLSSSSVDSYQVSPDFPLIARILDMNTGIFTDINSAPARALFENLTIHGRATSIKDLDTFSTEPWSDPRAICHKIAIPLMQAYASTRNLPAFLEQWLACLSSQAATGNAEWLLWTDLSLEESLRDILETSLTSTQIAELLDSQRDNLTQSFSSESGAGPRTFSSTILLNAIVGAVRTDATIDTLIPHLESLVAVVEGAFAEQPNIGSLVAAQLLTLCSRLYHLWYPIWSTSHSSEEIQARNPSFLSGSITNFALRKIQLGAEEDTASSTSGISEVDSAFVLIASTCDMQRRLTGHESDYALLFCRAALPSGEKNMSSSYAAQRPVAFMTVLTGFPELLSCIPTTERIRLFSALLVSLSSKASRHKSALVEFLSAVFAASDFPIKDDLFTAVSSAVGESNSLELWLEILLQWPLKGFSRQQREKILNAVVSSLLQITTLGQEKQQALELVAGLLEVPNATANISVDPALLWEISGLPYNQTELKAFEEVCKRLLKHILDTKEQDRSKSYLKQLSELVSEFISKQKDLALASAPGKVQLLTVLFETTEARLKEEELSSLPHRSSATIDAFVKRLWEVLSTCSEGALGGDGDNLNIARLAIESFNSVPTSILQVGSSSADKYTKRFAKKLRSLLEDSKDVPVPLLVGCFEQLSSIGLKQDPLDVCTNAELLLARDMDARQYWMVTDAFTKTIKSVSEDEKISLIDRLIPAADAKCTAERVVLVRCIISAIQASRKHTEASSSEPGSMSILVRILGLLHVCAEYDVHQQLVACVVSILRDQPNLVTQYSAEMTIATVTTLASPSSPVQSVKQASPIFEGLCSITQSLLQFHRSSLGGRFHLLVPLMQRLLACLFVPSTRDAGTTNRFKHPAWLESTSASLSLKHAQRYSRLLENLCNPPQSNVSGARGKSTPDLVDETRKARMHVAQHAPHILHYFCTLILHGKLGEGMRGALTPGMWAIIDVAEIDADDSRGIKALSASMGNADRAILRSVWEDWRRFGGAWKG